MNTTQPMTTQFLLSLLFLLLLFRPIPAVGSPFTEKVQRTKDAINIGLTHAQGDHDFVSSIPPQSDVRTARALKSCVELFQYAVDSFHNALAFMDQLGTPGTPSFREQIWKTNVQLTAADTNARTCQESLDIMKDGPLKTQVSNRADVLSNLAGNALSLLVKIG